MNNKRKRKKIKKKKKGLKEPTVRKRSRITLLLVLKSWADLPQRAIKGGRGKKEGDKDAP
jgi:hypothetical protein